MSGMGGAELAQFQVGPADLSDGERFAARALVIHRARGDQDRDDLLAMLGLPLLPADHGTTARFREGCVCVVCVGHQERIRGWAA